MGDRSHSNYPLTRAIGAELRSERERQCLTLMQLGKMTNPPFNWKRIQFYEVGHRKPDLDTLDTICQALRVDILVIIERARHNRAKKSEGEP